MDARRLLANEAGLEEHLGTAEAFASDGDDVTVRQLVGFLLVGTLAGLLHFSVEVQGDKAELLLDVPNDFTLSSRGERVTTFCKNLHHVFSQVASSEVQAQDGVGQRIALVDWHSVRNTIARIHDDASGAPRSVQREHCLNG